MGRVALRLIALMTALLCLSGAAIPAVAASTRASSSSYHLDLYQAGSFVTQYRWTWCVGASSQAMLNIIQGTSDTSLGRQRQLVKYAMGHDGFPNSNTGGSDAVGFANVLTHFGGGSFALVLSTNFRQAVASGRQAHATHRQAGRVAGHGRPPRLGADRL